jgi:serine/threonine protein kinase
MKQVEHTNSEQRMLSSVQHPFIINLWGTFQDCSNLYMVMDFVPGGELFTLLRRSNVRPPAPSFVHSLPSYRDSPIQWQNSMPQR